MNDKYNTYDDRQFKYDYPITWERKNISYLEKYHDTKVKKSYNYKVVTVPVNDEGNNN